MDVVQEAFGNVGGDATSFLLHAGEIHDELMHAGDVVSHVVEIVQTDAHVVGIEHSVGTGFWNTITAEGRDIGEGADIDKEVAVEGFDIADGMCWLDEMAAAFFALTSRPGR